MSANPVSAETQSIFARLKTLGRRSCLKLTINEPQKGSVVSPILANIYLHYAFDLRVDRWRGQMASGDVIITTILPIPSWLLPKRQSALSLSALGG
jgi:hypothetical protein